MADVTITIPDNLVQELQAAAQEVKGMTAKEAAKDFCKFLLVEYRTRQKLGEVEEPVFD